MKISILKVDEGNCVLINDVALNNWLDISIFQQHNAIKLMIIIVNNIQLDPVEKFAKRKKIDKLMLICEFHF